MTEAGRGHVESRQALVLGGTGVIGTALVNELVSRRIEAVAVCRSDCDPAGESDGVTRWVTDCSALDLASAPVDLSTVTEVYNCTGRVDLDMTADEAGAANVAPVRAIVDFVSRLKGQPRLVHVSGYRTAAGSQPASGKYARSKQRAEAVFRRAVAEAGVDWSIVNPCTVTSATNRAYAHRDDPLVAVVDKLWRGVMPIVPAAARTFVPVIRDDLLAKFMVAVAADPAARSRSFYPMDFETPYFQDLVNRIADALQVRRPVAAVSPRALQKLPPALTDLTAAAAEFLSTDTYPSEDTKYFATRHGLSLSSSSVQDVSAWARHVVAARACRGASRATSDVSDMASTRTFSFGSPRARVAIFPGLPVDSISWAPVLDLLAIDPSAPLEAAAIDLPGPGRSAPLADEDWRPWIAAALRTSAPARTVVGHSIGCAAALDALDLDDNPPAKLVLVSPFFLQTPAPFVLRRRLPVFVALRLSSPRALAQTLLGDKSFGNSLASVSTALRRPGVAWQTAGHVVAAADARWRATLRDQLVRANVPVTVICGENDRLSTEGLELAQRLDHVTVEVVPGGHHMHIDHPAPLAAAIRAAVG